MNSLTLALLLTAGLFLAGLTFDISVNGGQDWYGTVYGDAFWSYRVQDSQALRDLALEEERIDQILKSQDLEQEAPHR
jgi:hypothetical protein